MDLTPFHGPPATAPRVPGFAARTLLGFGTHGEVWLADDLSSGGRVALKIGRRAPEPAVASGDPPGLEQETALLCRIAHPHIVRLQRVVPLPAGGLAMVLDLASGGSLAALVAARGRFDPGEVSTLLVPLADALDHLHRRGVVHGDLAPTNVLFTGDGRPQLGDLGAARVLGARVEQAWATPGFTDPALTGPGVGGPDLRAADLWGLAAVGWFALTGRPPGPAADGDPGPGPGPGQAPELAALLTECLRAAPADRPSLPELADRAWQAAPPVPVRLVPGLGTAPDGAGLPPLSDRVTRAVSLPGDLAAGGAADQDSGAADRARAVVTVGAVSLRPPGPGRERRQWGEFAARHPGVAVVALLAVASTVVVSTVAATGLIASRPGAPAEAGGDAAVRTRAVHSGPAGAPLPAGTGSGSAAATGAQTPGEAASRAGLEAELTRALIAIGRARAAAFRRASADPLAAADVTGSPAYLQDLGLVRRLRARGYRLHGVRYEVSGVRVLRRRGELVDVRALVTTSGHDQVRVGAGARVPVPADGPRPVVLTVAPVDRNASGPARWRVRSVQTSS